MFQNINMIYFFYFDNLDFLIGSRGRDLKRVSSIGTFCICSSLLFSIGSTCGETTNVKS